MSDSGSHNPSKPPITKKVNHLSITDTPNEIRVKNSATGQVTITLKGQELLALKAAAKERKVTASQYVREAIEKALIRDGALPSWWFNRQF